MFATIFVYMLHFLNFFCVVVSLKQFMQMHASRGFPRVYFTRPWGNREGTALPYIERIDNYGNSVLYVCVCFLFVLNSE